MNYNAKYVVRLTERQFPSRLACCLWRSEALP